MAENTDLALPPVDPLPANTTAAAAAAAAVYQDSQQHANTAGSDAQQRCAALPTPPSKCLLNDTSFQTLNEGSVEKELILPARGGDEERQRESGPQKYQLEAPLTIDEKANARKPKASGRRCRYIYSRVIGSVRAPTRESHWPLYPPRDFTDSTSRQQFDVACHLLCSGRISMRLKFKDNDISNTVYRVPFAFLYNLAKCTWDINAMLAVNVLHSISCFPFLNRSFTSPRRTAKTCAHRKPGILTSMKNYLRMFQARSEWPANTEYNGENSM